MLRKPCITGAQRKRADKSTPRKRKYQQIYISAPNTVHNEESCHNCVYRCGIEYHLHVWFYDWSDDGTGVYVCFLLWSNINVKARVYFLREHSEKLACGYVIIVSCSTNFPDPQELIQQLAEPNNSITHTETLMRSRLRTCLIISLVCLLPRYCHTKRRVRFILCERRGGVYLGVAGGRGMERIGGGLGDAMKQKPITITPRRNASWSKYRGPYFPWKIHHCPMPTPYQWWWAYSEHVFARRRPLDNLIPNRLDCSWLPSAGVIMIATGHNALSVLPIVFPISHLGDISINGSARNMDRPIAGDG